MVCKSKLKDKGEDRTTHTPTHRGVDGWLGTGGRETGKANIANVDKAGSHERKEMNDNQEVKTKQDKERALLTK